MLIKRKRGTIKEQREKECMAANVERLQASIEYIAAVQEIEIATEETDQMEEK